MVQIPKKLQSGNEDNHLGRSLKGEIRNCQLCNTQIYVKPYRIKKGQGQYCIHCVKKQQSLSIHAALKGLVVYSDVKTVKEMGDRAIKLLVKYLNKNPVGTVDELLGKNEFTVEDLINSTLETLTVEVLKQADEFECIDGGLGIWRLKVQDESKPNLVPEKEPEKVSVIQEKPKPVEGIHPIFEDYPGPWAKVKNREGNLIRYEDAQGNVIPKALWSSKDS